MNHVPLPIRRIDFRYPVWSLRIIAPGRTTGSQAREWATDWRGMVAFCGQGRVHALAELVDVVPLARGYLWRYERFRFFDEAIDISGRGQPIWDSPRGLEPPFVPASTANAINSILGSVWVDPEAVMLVPVEIDYFEAVAVNKRGQLEMF